MNRAAEIIRAHIIEMLHLGLRFPSSPITAQGIGENFCARLSSLVDRILADCLTLGAAASARLRIALSQALPCQNAAAAHRHVGKFAQTVAIWIINGTYVCRALRPAAAPLRLAILTESLIRTDTKRYTARRTRTACRPAVITLEIRIGRLIAVKRHAGVSGRSGGRRWRRRRYRRLPYSKLAGVAKRSLYYIHSDIREKGSHCVEMGRYPDS